MNKKESSETKNAPLGEFIKSRRESRNITKADACRRSGLDYSYWVKLEAGVYQMPSPKALDLVADVIGCKPADLYVLAGYKIGGELPGFGAYLRTTTYLPPEAIDHVRAHLDGAIPVDLLKEEQDRIADEMAQAQRQLNATDVDWNTVETNLTLALGLVSDCKQAYRRGGPRVRRRYNQAFWDAIYVDDDGVSYARLAEPFSQVLPGDIKNKVEETKNPDQHGTGRGFSKNDLVGAEGLEPPTSAL